jgi:ComF family protein
MGMTRISGNICPQCGEPQAGAKLCNACQAIPPDYYSLRSFALFQGPLRKAIHRLKYERDIGLGEALSKHMIELYNVNKWKVDVIVPVPLSPKRHHDRGYNQASLLGRPLAYAIQKPFRTDMLVRSRETHTQVGLTAFERKRNVEGAFSTRPNLVTGKSILIIDDVTTTGSTISACAKALRQAGASAVYGLTLARAVLQADADDQPNPSQRIGGNYGS